MMKKIMALASIPFFILAVPFFFIVWLSYPRNQRDKFFAGWLDFLFNWMENKDES